MTETGFWASIREPFHKYAGHVTRVENIAGNGIPDVDICLNGASAKVELKVATGSKIHIQHTQRVWWEARKKAGGIHAVFVLVRTKDRVMLYTANDLLSQPRLPGKNKKNFTVDLAPVTPLLWFKVRRPEWGRLFDTLFYLAGSLR